MEPLPLPRVEHQGASPSPGGILQIDKLSGENCDLWSCSANSPPLKGSRSDPSQPFRAPTCLERSPYRPEAIATNSMGLSIDEGERPRDFFERPALGGNAPAPLHKGSNDHQHRAKKITGGDAGARAGVDERA